MSAAPFRWCEDRHPWCHRLQTRWDHFRRLRLRDKGCLDPQWLSLLDAENVQTVILSRHEDRDLLQLLHRSPQWAVDFADQRSVILVRRAAANVVELGNMTS
jgi:hypothetical protein